MVKFVCGKQPQDQPLSVELTQDNDDVNIVINNELLGWLDSDGKLYLMPNRQGKIPGLDLDKEGRIKIGKA